ncbi:MAG TPA: alpha/beta hydrolase [Xanthobacteraceae bacterium]|jgi:pimeloyl-ACP methyl ester carboxylesterase
MMIIVIILISLAIITGLYVAINWAPELTVEELRGRWGNAPSVFLDVAGKKVHLRDEGPRNDPTPLVLLHGTGHSLHTWDGWVAALKGARRVIRFDLAGCGLTGPAADDRYSIDDDVRLVVAILDRLGIDRCVLGGNSLGGLIAWRTALEHPERVEKLILVDADGYRIAPKSVPLAFRFARLPMSYWLISHTLPRGLVEQTLRNVYGDPTKVTAEAMLRSRELTRREGNRRAFVLRARQEPQLGDLSHRIAELKMPTLIIWGGRDRLIPRESAQRFHRDIAGSALVMFEDLGHMPQEEDPGRTAEAVQRFLASPA